MSQHIERLGETFASVDWIVPPYIQMGHLQRLAARIEREPNPIKKREILDAALPDLYPPMHTAAMLLERYEKTPHVLEFKGVIAEAIEAAYLGLVHVAVTSLIPVMDARPRSGRRCRVRDEEARR